MILFSFNLHKVNLSNLFSIKCVKKNAKPANKGNVKEQTNNQTTKEQTNNQTTKEQETSKTKTQEQQKQAEASTETPKKENQTSETPKEEEKKSIDAIFEGAKQVEVNVRSNRLNVIISTFLCIYLIYLINEVNFEGLLGTTQEKGGQVLNIKTKLEKVISPIASQYKTIKTSKTPELEEFFKTSIEKNMSQVVVFPFQDSKELYSKEKFEDLIRQASNKRTMFVMLNSIFASDKDIMESSVNDFLLAILSNLLIHQNSIIFKIACYAMQLNLMESIIEVFSSMVVGSYGEDGRSQATVGGMRFLIVKQALTDPIFKDLFEKIMLEVLAIYNVLKDNADFKIAIEEFLKLGLPVFNMKKFSNENVMLLSIISFVLYKNKNKFVFT